MARPAPRQHQWMGGYRQRGVGQCCVVAGGLLSELLFPRVVLPLIAAMARPPPRQHQWKGGYQQRCVA
eukprot:6068990-Prorocentrum_lima.AAC.1